MTRQKMTRQKTLKRTLNQLTWAGLMALLLGRGAANATLPLIPPYTLTEATPALAAPLQLAQATAPSWQNGTFRTVVYGAQVGGHRTPVRDVVFSPDGQFLATGGADNTIKIWNLRERLDRSLVRTISLNRSDREVDSLAFSPDGRTLVSGSYDGKVRMWDWRRGQLLQTWTEHTQVVKALEFTADGTVLASGSLDGQILLRDVRTGGLLRRIQTGQGIEAIALSPNGQIIAGGGIAKKVGLWEWQRDRQIRELGPYDRPIYSLMFSRDGETLIFSPDAQSITVPVRPGDEDEHNTVRFWNLRGREQGDRLVGHRDYVVSMCLNSYGQLITASLDMTFKIWNTETQTLIRSFQEERGGILSANFRSDGRAFAIATRDGDVKVYISR